MKDVVDEQGQEVDTDTLAIADEIINGLKKIDLDYSDHRSAIGGAINSILWGDGWDQGVDISNPKLPDLRIIHESECIENDLENPQEIFFLGGYNILITKD